MVTQSIYKSPAGEKAIMATYDAVLAHWPMPLETFNIDTRYGKAFALGWGQESEPPVVLLHGAGSNSSIWRGAAVELGRKYRVYAVDLMGEPGKSDPERPEWDSLAFSEWLEDVLNGLKCERVVLCGVSQGGWTALKFAVNHPERVTKLVLLSPGGIVPDRLSFILKVIPLSMMGTWGNERIKRLIFAGHTVVKELDDYITLINNQFIPRMGILPLFSDDELRRLNMPALLLMGE
jgi:pimeloyl-ACP methyl ester carboxylesterase